MTLRLNFQGQTNIPVEVEGVTPDAVRELSLAQIEKLPIFHGNQQQVLADFFTVTGDASDSRLEWEGDLSGVHWIGAKMKSGEVRITSNGGRHIGSEMRGGEIHVSGNVGDWLGGEMHGGLIHVRGNAGHLVGAAYRGSPRGMNRGTILIHGNAGNEIGSTMRRGLIAVGGRVGDMVGFNMLAGSVFLFGATGNRHGAGMKRGTIAFVGKECPQLLPSYRFSCRFRPDYLSLVARQLQKWGFASAELLHELSFDLYNGDMIEGGRGEILIRA